LAVAKTPSSAVEERSPDVEEPALAVGERSSEVEERSLAAEERSSDREVRSLAVEERSSNTTEPSSTSRGHSIAASARPEATNNRALAKNRRRPCRLLALG
jgi:hypothetical protein